MSRGLRGRECTVAGLPCAKHLTTRIQATKRDPGANQLRNGNLLKRAARYKGAITPEVMMKSIMDVDIKDGGATHAGTIFQVVAAPADRKVWIKVPGRVDWTEVPLEPLFRR